VSNAVQQHAPFAVEHVIQFGGAFVIVFARAVDVHGMRPRGHVAILPADEQIPPTARAPLARGFAFMPNEDG
jgi:hypothetical protein